jgi:hypothetical protein
MSTTQKQRPLELRKAPVTRAKSPFDPGNTDPRTAPAFVNDAEVEIGIRLEARPRRKPGPRPRAQTTASPPGGRPRKRSGAPAPRK